MNTKNPVKVLAFTLILIILINSAGQIKALDDPNQEPKNIPDQSQSNENPEQQINQEETIMVPQLNTEGQTTDQEVSLELQENQNSIEEEKNNENQELLTEDNIILINIDDINNQTLKNQTSNKTNESIQENITNQTSLQETTYELSEETSSHNKQETNENTELKENSNISEADKNPEINLPEENKEVRKIKTTLSRNDKIELEGEIPENFDINNIQKKEYIIDASKTGVIVSSEEHLEAPLTIYADIAKIKRSQTSSVRVYWVNEEKSVEITGFYDLDEDGFYERISWVVPHLSEQTFEITINLEEGNSSSTEIIIDSLIVPQSNAPLNSSLVEFKFNISYNLSLLTCNLEILSNINTSIKNIEMSTTSSQETINLEDGLYSWHLLCSDEINNKSASKSGNFEIKEGYDIYSNKEIYLLGESPIINIKSNNDKNVSIIITKPNGENITKYTPGESNLNLAPSEINQRGEYTILGLFDNLEENIYKTKKFQVIQMEINITNPNMKTNEDTEIKIGIYSPSPNIQFYELKFGDNSQGSIDSSLLSNPQNIVTRTITHKYSQEGIYTLNLTAITLGGQIFSIQRNGINITTQGDKINPEVTQTYPKNNEEINSNKVTFKYTPTDNIKLANCTFELYIYDGNSGKLDYEEKKSNPQNNTEIQISLKDFEEASYSWNVFCCDNSSNCNSEFKYDRDFSIELNSTNSIQSSNEEDNIYPEKDQVEETKDMLDSFLYKQQSFDLEKQEALTDLGITDNLTYFRKRLIQIGQDLDTNLKFISGESAKEEKRKELIKELNRIRKDIPLDMKILEQTEYNKNSLSSDLKAITEEYFKIKQIKTDEKSIKKIADLNFEIQNYLTTSTKSKQLEIEYEDTTRKITLITKDLTLKNNSFETLLEILPEKMQGSIFITPSKKLTDSIIEIHIDDLEEDKIIYYKEAIVDLDSAEIADTIILKNFKIESSKITGFLALGFGINNAWLSYLILIIFILIIIYLLMKAIKKIRFRIWKKEEDVRRVIGYTRKAKEALKQNNIIAAKEEYHKIKEIYPLLPKGFRKYSFRELKKIMMGIDRREIIGLVKEYERTNSQGKDNEAKKIYESIRATYKRLPKKDQQKIYNKMFRNDFEI